MIRKMRAADVPQLIELYKQLSDSGSDLVQAIDIFNARLKEQCYTLVYILNGKVVGSISIYAERKYYHYGKFVLHIEDVVVDKNCRNMGIGKQLISTLVDRAKKYRQDYKVVLSCKEDKVGFYEKCGFHQSGVEMRMDIDD